MRETEEIDRREKGKVLLKAHTNPSITIETKMIKGVFTYLNISQFIIKPSFIIPTFTFEKFSTSFPLPIILNSSNVSKLHFKLMLPPRLQLTQSGQKHSWEIGLDNSQEKSFKINIRPPSSL